MPEAIAPDGSGAGSVVAVPAVAVPAVPVLFRRALGGGDELGEHAGEGVDLMAPELGAAGGVRGALRQDALESEHEAVAHLPAGGRIVLPGGDLGERVVEGRPA